MMLKQMSIISNQDEARIYCENMIAFHQIELQRHLNAIDNLRHEIEVIDNE